jgi:hypothetical protein
MLVKTVPALGFIEFCVEALYMDEKQLSPNMIVLIPLFFHLLDRPNDAECYHLYNSPSFLFTGQSSKLAHFNSIFALDVSWLSKVTWLLSKALDLPLKTSRVHYIKKEEEETNKEKERKQQREDNFYCSSSFNFPFN